MDAKERARKIGDEAPPFLDIENRLSFEDMVAAQIEEAERTAYVDAMKDWELKASAEMKKLVWNAAREKAKGIVDQQKQWCAVHGIAVCACLDKSLDRIAAMTPDGEGE